MTIEYIKSEIYNLGFSSETDTEAGIVLQAINRAIDTIASTVRPIIGSQIINKDTPKHELSNQLYSCYDFKALAREKQESFIAFTDKYVIENSFIPVTDFFVLNRCILQLPNDQHEYIIYYKKMYTPITEQTISTTEIELDSDLHVLVPLLAAFYVWQDDEERKADKWYNDYETKRNDILGRECKVVAVVKGSGDYGC